MVKQTEIDGEKPCFTACQSMFWIVLGQNSSHHASRLNHNCGGKQNIQEPMHCYGLLWLNKKYPTLNSMFKPLGSAPPIPLAWFKDPWILVAPKLLNQQIG